MIGSRGAIVDDKGRLLANTTGHVVVVADTSSLGSFDTPRLARDARRGSPSLRKVSALAHVPVKTMLVAHPAVGRPLAVRARGRHPAPEQRPAVLSRRASDVVSRLRRDRGPVAQLSAGRLRQRVPRPARRGEPARARHDALPDGEGRRGRRPDRRRGGVRLAAQPRLRPRARARRLARPHRRPSPGPARQVAADAEADDRRAHPARGPERRSQHGIQLSAGDRPPPHRRLGGRHEPVHGRHLRARERADVQPGRRGERSELQREALHRPARSARRTARSPACIRPGSTFKPIIAEAALSAGIITPDTSLLCSRRVRPRRLRLPQRRGGRVREHDAAHGARAVVRHVVLPARRPRSTPPTRASRATLIQQWARKFGLGSTPPIDVTGAAPGYLPGAGQDVREAHGLPVDGGPDDQPRHRPGRAAGEPAPARGRVLDDRERRHGRAAARRRRASCAAA